MLDKPKQIKLQVQKVQLMESTELNTRERESRGKAAIHFCDVNEVREPLRNGKQITLLCVGERRRNRGNMDCCPVGGG